MKKQIDILEILKEFHTITGFRISIHDAEFNEIYGYPEKISEYCSCIQRNKRNKNICIESDRLAFEKVKASGDIEIYHCKHGLYEAVAPIYHYGELSGYFMMGQVCEDKKKYQSQLFHSINAIIKNEAKSENIVQSVKEVPVQFMHSYIVLMKIIAEYITQTHRLAYNKGDLAILLLKYLKQNYATKITLSSLSERFYCSQSTLVKSFKKTYHTSIFQELNKIRLEKAVEYLIESRLTIKEIAEKCGFTDQNYFSKAFTHQYGMSPKKYRLTNSTNKI